MKKLLIIDGSNLLFQMFFGMPSRIINKDGKAIQGTLGFVGALLKIIRRVVPSHVVVIFDGECENERRKLNPEYKSNRPDWSAIPEEDTPFSQLEDIYRALDCLGIRHTETTDCETDDIIAGYALTLRDNCKIVISSYDSDFFQLICENVSILRYRGDNTVIADPQYIRQRLMIEPFQYADYKSLVGDAADNIKGADGIGPKTAAALLSELGSLENIICNSDKISKPSVRRSVEQNRDRLVRNLLLIKLTSSARLPFSLGELEYSDRGLTTTQVLVRIGLK